MEGKVPVVSSNWGRGTGQSSCGEPRAEDLDNATNTEDFSSPKGTGHRAFTCAEQTPAVRTPPVVLFACVHNSGRSVAAKVLAQHYGGDALEVRSAGSEPGDGVNPQVAAVLADRGLITNDHTPSLLTYDGVQEADVVVTMGCGETCPVFPGKTYEDWQVDDPAGQDRQTVERIVDDIDSRVRDLLSRLDSSASGSNLSVSQLAIGRSDTDKSAREEPPVDDVEARLLR
jgi:arsenate reductase